MMRDGCAVHVGAGPVVRRVSSNSVRVTRVDDHMSRSTNPMRMTPKGIHRKNRKTKTYSAKS